MSGKSQCFQKPPALWERLGPEGGPQLGGGGGGEKARCDVPSHRRPGTPAHGEGGKGLLVKRGRWERKGLGLGTGFLSPPRPLEPSTRHICSAEGPTGPQAGPIEDGAPKAWPRLRENWLEANWRRANLSGC